MALSFAAPTERDEDARLPLQDYRLCRGLHVASSPTKDAPTLATALGDARVSGAAMTTEELAAKLTGVERAAGISREFEADARLARLVIVSSAGDDLMTFRGAIRDELDACDGCIALIDADGLFLPWEETDTDDVDVARAWFRREARNKATIEALWCSEAGYLWTYRTNLPHASFEVLEDGQPCCRGIVFALTDLLSSLNPTTKAEQAAPRRTQADLDVAAALRWSGLNNPAMVPVPTDGRTTGWVITTYNRGAVERAWSGPATHHRGTPEDSGQVRQGGIRLYGSERDAWIALRIAKEGQFAVTLAGFDAQINATDPGKP